jgi:CheY-like chemotaxis protein
MANILVVEDRKDDQLTIKSVLEAKNHKVQLADNGKKAMELLNKDSSFDLVIIDVILPDISGVKLFEYIRERLDKKIKCIFVTIVPEREIEKSKINGFVQKPYMPSELYNEINNCLRTVN